LGSPRINTDRDGNVTSRTDYYPYGEEIIAHGGRTANEGYVADDIRQGFTGYIYDDETDLVFARARIYAKNIARFTSADVGPFTIPDPQNLNRYIYVQNNPLKFVDSDGKRLRLTGEEASSLLEYLSQKSGLNLVMDKKGYVTVAKNSSRDENNTSKELADLLNYVIGQRATASFNVAKDLGDGILVDDGGDAIDEKRKTINVDMGDIRSIDSQHSDFATTLVSHFLAEGLEIGKGNFNFIDDVQMLPNGRTRINRKGAHTIGIEEELKVLSGFTGVSETKRDEAINRDPNKGNVYQFIYTSVQFDVYYKSDSKSPSGFRIRVDKKSIKDK
jgi:RHS repeat-associated protein